MSKQLLRCGTSIGANRRTSEHNAKLAWALLSEKEENEVNVREGQYAQSKKDFISKMNRRPSERRANVAQAERRAELARAIPRQSNLSETKLAWAFPSEKEEDEVNIALKEAGETDYWLDVIHSADYFSEEEYASLDADNKEPTTSRA